MQISLIAAMATNRIIGMANQLPWQMPADLNYFKQTTMKKPIIMGRKTYESIGRPLPGRTNVIITRDKDYIAEKCTVVHSIDSALTHLKAYDEVFIIGGSIIFEQALPLADRLYITEIKHDFSGDAYFPQWPDGEWQEISRQSYKADDKNAYDYDFVIYERIA